MPDPAAMQAIDQELEMSSVAPPSLSDVMSDLEPTAEEAEQLQAIEKMALKDVLHISACPSILMRMSATIIIAQLCSSEEGRRSICQMVPDPVPRLIGLIKDPHEGLRAHGYSALANLCEEEGAAVRLAEAGAGLHTMSAILDVVRRKSRMPEGCSKLLVNMTRVDFGRKAVLSGATADGDSEGGVGALSQNINDLVDAFEASREKPGDPLAWLALFFENIAREKEGADLLCNSNNGGFLLARIARGLAGSNTDRQIGAAGAIKNCCFYPENHERISEHLEVAALLALPLVGPADSYDEDDKDGMYAGLARKCRMGSKVSESAELRFMLYEALLLLTRTQVGRTLLRNAKVYPVLREVHKFENSFQIPIDEHIEALEIIVEQTVLLDEPDVD